MKVRSFAKLNLFLHITGKREDGYHNLQTVFCRLDFADTLTFLTGYEANNAHAQPTSSPLIRLTCDSLTDNINDNLIAKSAHALLDFSTKHGIGTPMPTHIILDKKIPTGAGLGGGSSNAGTTLLTLNKLWNLHLDTPTLIGIAKTLGADVPFFVLDTPYAIGEGIGEILTPIDLPHSQFLLLFPNSHNSTQGFFGRPELKKDSPTLSHNFIIQNQALYTHHLGSPFFNAFEAIALEDPNIFHAHTYLKNLTTHATPRLTGTGSTVFLPIHQNTDETLLTTWQQNAPYTSRICCSI